MELTIDTMQEAQAKINMIMGLLVNCKTDELAAAPRGKVKKAIAWLFEGVTTDEQIAAMDHFVQKAVLVWADGYYGRYVPNAVLMGKFSILTRKYRGYAVRKGIILAEKALTDFYVFTQRLSKDKYIHEIMSRNKLVIGIKDKLTLGEYDYPVTEQHFTYIMTPDQKDEVLNALTRDVNKVQPITMVALSDLANGRLTLTELFKMYGRISSAVKLPRVEREHAYSPLSVVITPEA